MATVSNEIAKQKEKITWIQDEDVDEDCEDDGQRRFSSLRLRLMG